MIEFISSISVVFLIVIAAQYVILTITANYRIRQGGNGYTHALRYIVIALAIYMANDAGKAFVMVIDHDIHSVNYPVSLSIGISSLIVRTLLLAANSYMIWYTTPGRNH